MGCPREKFGFWELNRHFLRTLATSKASLAARNIYIYIYIYIYIEKDSIVTDKDGESNHLY